MGQLVVAAAGAAIGFAVGGPAGAKWGWALGSMAGGALLAEDVEGPRLGDLRVTGTEYGATIPWVAGSPRIAGQIVWASPKRETANTQSAKGGPEQTTYTYDCDLLILLTENEIAGVSRIWSNSELVWNGTTTKSGVWGGFTVYTGAADQLPDPTYEAAVGVGNAPAYRGRGYVVITGLQLGGGGAIPNLTFELNAGAYADPYIDYVEMLLYCGEAGFLTESAPKNAGRVITTYGTGTQAAGGEFGDCLSITSAGIGGLQLTYGELTVVDAGQDFTMEFSIFVPDAFPTNPFGTPFIHTGVTTSGLAIRLRPNGLIEFGTKSQGEFLTTATPVSLDRWHRIAFSRTANVLYAFVDGNLDAQVANSLQIGTTGTSDDDFYVGSGKTLTLNVKLDSFRFTRGVGRYTDSYTLINGNFGTDAPTDSGYTFDALQNSTGSVVNSLTQRCGYELGDVDFSELPVEQLCRGLAISNVSSTRATLDVLKSAYFFEASKSDKIYIRPRATTPVATISYAELGAGTDAGGSDQAFELTKSNDLEVPAQIALSYANMAGDYNSATEYSDRVLSQQETISGVQLPLGLLPAEAKAIADGLIIDAASSVVRATLRVPLKYAYIEPGDVFNAVNDDGRTYRLRVQTKRDSLTLIELECVLDDVGALDSAAVTDAGYTEAAVVQVAASEFEALDIPILRDADNGPGYYIGVAPDVQTDPYEWKGALVARSWDDVSYSELFQATTASVMGACSTTLGNWTGGNVWDEANTLTVVTTGGELASSTKAALQLDPTLNVAAIGSQASGWEIVRFVNATLTAANTYLLSGLHRGFRGTEWRMASHGAGEQFVLLNAGVGHVQSQTNQIGLERHIKAVTFGLLLSSATSEAFTDTGVALKPFSPANPVALASGSDLVVTWQRRTRVSYTYLGATPTVPLGESAEQYRVRIYDGATLVRTDTVTAPTYTYTAANLASDGFASTDPVTFEICQVSEIVGAGYPATIQGTAP